jgi:hypothetical protein
MSTDILARAADKLGDLAYETVTEMRNDDSYWGRQADNDTYRKGIANAVGGHSGNLAAVQTPGYALAVAAWLQSLSGVEVREDGPLSDEYAHALKAARELLGEASP